MSHIKLQGKVRAVIKMLSVSRPGLTFNWVSFFLPGLLLSCNNQEKIKPTFENISESVYAAGTIKANHQYEIFSTVSGIVDKVLVTENDLVRVGTPLITIASNAAKISRANAELQATFERLETNQDKLKELQDNINLAAIKYSNDSLLFKRQENLWQEHIGSKVDLEQKKIMQEKSKNELLSARIKYDNLNRQLRLNAGQSTNYRTLSIENENDYTIKSNAEGKVYTIVKEKGEMVTPQMALGIIGDAANFIIELQIDEFDISRIKMGQRVFVSMDSYKGKVFEAQIQKIYPVMNDRTKSFLVEAGFITTPALLYPNLTVETNILIQTKQKAMVIPRSYLVNDSMVLTGMNKLTTVVTGFKDYSKVEIIRGLTPEEYIYKPK
jgi:HlyD family secretion protein